MAFILTRLNECHLETAGSMEELNKTGDEQDKPGAWAKNVLHHHGQVPEDPEKVFRSTKVEAELLKRRRRLQQSTWLGRRSECG